MMSPLPPFKKYVKYDAIPILFLWYKITLISLPVGPAVLNELFGVLLFFPFSSMEINKYDMRLAKKINSFKWLKKNQNGRTCHVVHGLSSVEGFVIQVVLKCVLFVFRGENVEDAFLDTAKKIYQNIQDGRWVFVPEYIWS